MEASQGVRPAPPGCRADAPHPPGSGPSPRAALGHSPHSGSLKGAPSEQKPLTCPPRWPRPGEERSSRRLQAREPPARRGSRPPRPRGPACARPLAARAGRGSPLALVAPPPHPGGAQALRGSRSCARLGGQHLGPHLRLLKLGPRVPLRVPPLLPFQSWGPAPPVNPPSPR